jgi:CRP/FNR family transcriptional regulator
MDLVEQATYFRLDQRLASLVLACGSPVSESHQELANDLGVSRENVSRVLSDFRERGWLRLGRRRIDILDPDALRAFLDRQNDS